MQILNWSKDGSNTGEMIVVYGSSLRAMAQPIEQESLQTATEMRAEKKMREHIIVVLLMVGIVVMGTLYKFVSRMRAQLLGEYNFAAVVPDAPSSLAFNLICLGICARRGDISRVQIKQMFCIGKTWSEMGLWKYIFLAAVNDTINLVTGMAAQPYLTTLMMSLMDQATTPFTVLCSLALLGTRYTALESISVLTVAAAAV
eukprot:3711996-Amphidinium_carterae.1